MYWATFEILTRLCPSLQQTFRFLLSDLAEAACNGANRVFPGVEWLLWNYHVKRAWEKQLVRATVPSSVSNRVMNLINPHGDRIEEYDCLGPVAFENELGEISSERTRFGAVNEYLDRHWFNVDKQKLRAPWYRKEIAKGKSGANWRRVILKFSTNMIVESRSKVLKYSYLMDRRNCIAAVVLR